MNIFIMEDDDNKYENLLNVMQEVCRDIKTTRFKCLNESLRHCREIEYDLYIVDIQVPVFLDKSWDINVNAGRVFIHRLNRGLSKDKCIIFSSEKPDEDEFLNWITYNPMYCDWKDQIINKIKEMV